MHSCEIHVAEVEEIAKGEVIEFVGERGREKDVEPWEIDYHKTKAEIDVFCVGWVYNQGYSFQG